MALGCGEPPPGGSGGSSAANYTGDDDAIERVETWCQSRCGDLRECTAEEECAEAMDVPCPEPFADGSESECMVDCVERTIQHYDDTDDEGRALEPGCGSMYYGAVACMHQNNCGDRWSEACEFEVERFNENCEGF